MHWNKNIVDIVVYILLYLKKHNTRNTYKPDHVCTSNTVMFHKLFSLQLHSTIIIVRCAIT